MGKAESFSRAKTGPVFSWIRTRGVVARMRFGPSWRWSRRTDSLTSPRTSEMSSRARALDLAALTRTPNALASHYSRFRVSERLLLTGHSHQAWPDIGFDGQVEAWNDAAELVDDKWDRSAAMADEVRTGFARLLGARPDEIALGQNTHELVIRFLSALPLAKRPRLVTTDGEFHTIRRQLDRFAEARVLEIVKVAAEPADTLAERLIAGLDARTAAVLVSSVMFGTGHIASGLGDVLAACRANGTELLVDAYHHLNV